MSRNGRLALVAAAIAIAVVAFMVLAPGDEEKSPAPTATTKAPAPGAQRITVRNGKPAGGVRTIAVRKGAGVRLTVSSPDTSGEVHVHGYDLKRELSPARPAAFRFDADIEGAFEIELEDTATKIATLEVRPG